MANPNTDIVILNALGSVLLPGTQLQAKQATVTPAPTPFYVHNKFTMSQGMFPALHLSAGTQTYHRISTTHYNGAMIAIVEYYDRWDSQSSTIDAIRASIAADLETMKTNAESNEDLVTSNVAHAVAIPQISLSPYRGEIDAETVPSQKLVYRTMTLTINILPYDQ